MNNDALILIVEDSDEDYEVLTLTFESQEIRNPLARVSEGDAVIPWLENRRAQHLPMPALILLDLNLIGLDGRTVLCTLKSRPDLNSIPVIVRSTSSNPKDVSLCLSSGAAAYCVKPVALVDLERFVTALKSFWLECASLPANSL